MQKPLRVLMVEDSEDDVLLVIRELKKGGYEPEYERVETASDCMRCGARDCVTKGNMARLVPTIEREMKEAESRVRRRQPRRYRLYNEARQCDTNRIDLSKVFNLKKHDFKGC